MQRIWVVLGVLFLACGATLAQVETCTNNDFCFEGFSGPVWIEGGGGWVRKGGGTCDHPSFEKPVSSKEAEAAMETAYGPTQGPGPNWWNRCAPQKAGDTSVVRLVAEVRDNQPIGAEIYPEKWTTGAEGTFAARLRFDGPTDSTWFYQSVKSFFTYPAASQCIDDNDLEACCHHVEHDFEVITEENHAWYYDEWSSVDPPLAPPRLTLITHERGDHHETNRECPELGRSRPEREGLDGIESLAPVNGRWVTLVVNVEHADCERRDGTRGNLVSRYSMYAPGLAPSPVVELGETCTRHEFSGAIRPMFNIWWSYPKDSQPVFSLLEQKQSMDIDWLLYTPERLGPALAHDLGTRCDAGDCGRGAPLFLFDDFSDGDFTTNPEWSVVNRDDRPAQVIEINQEALHIERWNALGNGGSAGISIDTDIPVDDETTAEIRVRPVSRDVGAGCGWICGEYPISLKLTLELLDGTEVTVRYAFNYGSAILDKFQPSSIQRAFSVPRDEWSFHRFRIRDDWPTAARVTHVFVFGNGWDYESWADDVRVGAAVTFGQ